MGTQKARTDSEHWHIRGLSIAGGALKRLPDRLDARFGVVQVSEFVSDIYGGSVWQGSTPVCHFTLEVPCGADPKLTEEYRRIEAMCTFGAAVQNLISQRASAKP